MADQETDGRRSKWDEDFHRVIGGYQRAVDWIRRHGDELRCGLSFFISPHREYGAEIDLGYFRPGDDQVSAARRLFAGKTATCTKGTALGDIYVVRDSEEELCFKWNVSLPHQETPIEVVSMTL